MGMVLTQHLSDNAGALLVRATVVNTHIVHGIKNAAVDRLQSVTNIG